MREFARVSRGPAQRDELIREINSSGERPERREGRPL
jgi:hypothetical protein